MPEQEQLLDALDRGFAYLAGILEGTQEGAYRGAALTGRVHELAADHYRYLKSLRPQPTPFDETYTRLREEAVTVPSTHPDPEAMLQEARAEAIALHDGRKADKVARALATGEIDEQEMAASKNERLAGPEDDEYDPTKAAREATTRRREEAAAARRAERVNVKEEEKP